MVDSPTNIFTSATDVGGVVPGNYCTLNPLTTTNYTYTNGNLRGVSRSSGDAMTIGTMGVTTGKWYFEGTIADNSYKGNIGIIGTTSGSFSGASYDTPAGHNALGYEIKGFDGTKRSNGTSSAYYGSVLPDSANVGIAFDLDNNKIFARVNGTWLASSDPVTGANPMFNITSVAGATYFPAICDDWGAATTTWDMNFGQRPFAYTPPTGFKSLNTTNIQALGTAAIGKAAITPNKWMDVTLYGGTGAARNVENSGFQPDLIWIKSRNGAQWHNITDSVRGAGAEIFTNAGNAEETNGGVSTINTNGFSLINWDGANKVTDNYVAWQWRQSPTSGLNIVSWTGDGTNNRAISHNLGVVPAMIICKERTGTP